MALVPKSPHGKRGTNAARTGTAQVGGGPGRRLWGPVFAVLALLAGSVALGGRRVRSGRNRAQEVAPSIPRGADVSAPGAGGGQDPGAAIGGTGDAPAAPPGRVDGGVGNGDNSGSNPTTGGAVPRTRRLPARRWIRHRVVPRETAVGIAARYRVRLASLHRWNPGLSERPEPGRVLRVYTDVVPPPRRKVTYVVRPGDTWWSVAVRHGIGSWDLRAMNYRPGGRLVPGETLTIWVDPVLKAAIDAQWDDPPLGVRPGGFGVGAPGAGRLVNGVQLPEHPAYIRKIPGSAYGTTHTIRTLVRALSDFRRRAPFAGRLYVGAISRPRGGRLGGHRSHQTGRDVDIRLPLRPEIPQALEPRPARRVDFRALYHLVRALVDTQEVVVIFLDYPLQRRLAKAARTEGAGDAELATLLQWPRGRRAARGIVRDSPGHDDHIHVRFRCGPAETECAALVGEGWGRPLDGPSGPPGSAASRAVTAGAR